MRLYLVRHAQSCWQLARSEDWDTSLSATGRTQAVRLGRWMASRDLVDADSRVEVSAVFTSPLRRAQETAAPVAKALGFSPVVLPNLREATFHVASHLSHANGPLLPHSPHRSSELYRAFSQQAQDAFTQLVEYHERSGGPALAVTHGGLIKTLLRQVIGSDAVCFKLYNSGMTTLEWSRGRWHLVHLNLCEHLPARLRTR